MIDVETHQIVFVWLLGVLAEHGLLRGKTVGIDATTLEANAALRAILRRGTGEQYEEFLRGLAKESGIETRHGRKWRNSTAIAQRRDLTKNGYTRTTATRAL